MKIHISKWSKKKWVLVSSGIVVFLLLLPWGFPLLLTGEHQVALQVVEHAQAKEQASSLQVMTINVAHGRKESFHQLLLDKQKIADNLVEVADVISQEQPMIVALQEADQSSFWSGGFNHIDFLAQKTGFARSVQMANVSGLGLSYGVALLSELALKEAKGHTFAFSWPTPPKGFLVAQLDWQGKPLTVVSLHLDFISSAVRKEQLTEVVAALQKHAQNSSLLVMGDFNCEWQTSEMQYFVKQLELHKASGTKGKISFPIANKLIDWILLSADLEFVDYQILPEKVSDHRAVWAEVKRKK